MKVFACLLALVTAGMIPAQGSDDPTVAYNDLGASYKTVYYNSGQDSAHAGVRVTFAKILQSVLAVLEGQYVPAQVQAKLKELFKDPSLWLIRNRDGDEIKVPNDEGGFKPTIKGVYLVPKSSDVVFVLDADVHFNGRFVPCFQLGEFLNRAKLPPAKVLEIRNGDAENKEPKSVGLTDRLTVSAGGSGIPAEVKLITAETDINGDFVLDANGKTIPIKAKARRFDLDATFAGVTVPAFARIDDGTFWNMTLDSTISEFALDQESSIALKFEATIPSLLMDSAAGIAYWKVSTQQSLRDTTAVAGFGWRFGDHRAHGRKSGKANFKPFAEIKDHLYFETVTELGFNTVKRFDDVPEDNRREGFIARPRCTLGFGDYPDSPWAVVGEASVYYLTPETGGAQDRDLRMAEHVSAKLIFRQGDSTECFIQYEFGHNPNSRFQRLTPAIKIGAKKKL